MASRVDLNERGGRPGRRWSTRGTVGVFVCVAVLSLFYFFTAPANHSEADDAFWYALDVETGAWADLFHPFHLSYLPLGRVVWSTVRFLGGPDRAYPALMALGAVATAGALLVAWDLLVRRLGIGRVRAGLATAVLGLTYGVWRYATEAEIYALALLVNVGLVHLALAGRPNRLGRIGVVVLGALAPFVHILAAVVSAIAVPVAIFSRRGWRATGRYMILTAALGLTFAFAGWRMAGSPDGDLLAFYRGGQEATMVRDIGDVARHGVAASQVLVSANFVLTYPSARRVLEGLFPGHMLQDEAFAGAHAPAAVGWVAPLTLLAVVASAGWLVSARGRATGGDARRAARRLAATWLLLHAIVGVLFSWAGQPESWMLAILPAWLLAVTLLVSNDTPLMPLAGVVIALLLHNGIGGLAVYANEDGDRHRAKAAWLVANGESSDAVLTAESAGFARYLAYWSRARVFDLQFKSSNEVREALQSAGSVPGRLFATGEIFDPPDFYRHLRPSQADSLQAATMSFRDDFAIVARDSFGHVFVRRRGHGVP